MRTIKINFSSNNNNESKSSIKDKIVNELFRRYPLNGYSTNTKDYYSKITHLKATNLFNNLFDCPFKCINPFKLTADTNKLRYGIPFYKYVRKEEDITLDKALFNIKNYVKDNDKDYDFTVFGVPVKFYDNFVQVGHYIIPYDDYKDALYYLVPKEKRQNVINVIYHVNNIITNLY